MKTIEHVIGELFIKTNLNKVDLNVETAQVLLGLEYEQAISLISILRLNQTKDYAEKQQRQREHGLEI